jgi:hypothetical protein
VRSYRRLRTMRASRSRSWFGNLSKAYAQHFGKKKPGAPVPKYNSAVGIAAKKTRKK